jgi:hypothetical protein
MNREFNPTSPVARALFAFGSAIVSLLIVRSITSRAEHYNAESTASVQQVHVAQR